MTSTARDDAAASAPARRGARPLTRASALVGRPRTMPVPQAPGAVVMIRPHRFTPNQMTAYDNVFQQPALLPAGAIARSARAEVTAVAERLAAAGVVVHLFEDQQAGRPDAVFPNNWFSTHPDGRVVLYPMAAANRRSERRPDVLRMLRETYRVRRTLDLSDLVHRGQFLEGTGAMVLDHAARRAYVARSQRADPRALARFAAELGHEIVLFDATDARGVPIYHTNVMMALGTSFAVIALETVRDPRRREELAQLLADGGRRRVIAISEDQMGAFAGNVLELSTPDGPVLALSATAHRALTAEQVRALEESCRLLPLSIPTIELAGGSVRCMLAGIHLEPRRAGRPPRGRSPIPAPGAHRIAG